MVVDFLGVHGHRSIGWPVAPFRMDLLLLTNHLRGDIQSCAGSEHSRAVGRERLKNVVTEEVLALLEVVCPGCQPCRRPGKNEATRSPCASTYHIAAPIRFDTENSKPMIGRPSSQEATKPNAEVSLEGCAEAHLGIPTCAPRSKSMSPGCPSSSSGSTVDAGPRRPGEHAGWRRRSGQ